MNNLEQSENLLVQSSNRKRQLCEVMVLLMLTLLVCGFFVLHGNFWLIWSAFCLVFASASFVLAMLYSGKALKDYRSARFTVNAVRVSTIEAIGVGHDVDVCLKRIEQRYFRRGGAKQKKNYCREAILFRIIERELGSQRTREVKPLIFKYTKI